jgi:hypothetical protein
MTDVMEYLFRQAKLKCTTCGESECDCWVKCSWCKWNYEKGKECTNPDCPGPVNLESGG